MEQEFARFQFNGRSYQRWRKRFWKCPVRLVTSGELADFWPLEWERRGSGAISSILPILALHARKKDCKSQWTEWASVSQRRLSLLGGVSRSTVARAMTALKDQELLETRSRPHPNVLGATVNTYRLCTTLYAERTERFAMVRGSLFYGGWWRVLPTSSARHLYLALCALDPIQDLRAFRRAMANKQGLDSLRPNHWLRMRSEIRQRHAASYTALQSYTGMARPTVLDALQILTTPLRLGDSQTLRFVFRGPYAPGKRRWAVPSRRLLRQGGLDFDLLNDAQGLEKIRGDWWTERFWWT